LKHATHHEKLWNAMRHGQSSWGEAAAGWSSIAWEASSSSSLAKGKGIQENLSAGAS
jgi:hypothetical protein